MTVARMAISLDARLAQRIRKAAGAEPLSLWLADAAARKLRSEGLLRAVAGWEAEHETISAEEMAAVERSWGTARSPKGRGAKVRSRR